MTPSVIENDVLEALGAFLTTVLGFPNGQVVIGQVNRVASPEGDYCVMWPLLRPRISTNRDCSADVKFTGSVSGTTLTVTEVDTGLINLGNTLFGVGVAANTTIVSQQSGDPGGAGVYTVSISQDIPSETLSAGTTQIKQSTKMTVQVDVHGPNAGDNAQIVQQLLRDEYGVEQFAGTGVTPLYADDPKQTPFITAANQYEERWTVDCHLQISPVITVPQQYADEGVVGLHQVT
jgi:hypothetical protein